MYINKIDPVHADTMLTLETICIPEDATAADDDNDENDDIDDGYDGDEGI